MILDEFLIALGVKADTKGLTDTAKGLGNVEAQAKKTDSSLSKFSTKLGGFITGFATFATAAMGSIQTIVVGAWAYLDSTIDKVEELQTAEDASIRTTKEQVEMAKKYRENMGLMGKTIDSVKTRIALGFLPTMFELSKTYSEFLNANKELISSGISKLLEWVSKAGQVFTNFIRFIDKLVTNTVGWKNALLILVGVLAIVKKATIAAFIANPITWIMVAIAGLLLLIDDFMTYLDGGESQFGEFWGSMLKWIEENQNGLNLIKDIFMGLVNFVVGALALLVGVFTGNTNLIKVVWDDAIESMIGVWYFFGNAIDDVLEAIGNYFKEKFNEISNYVGGIVNGIVNYFKGMINAISTFSSVIYTAVTTPFRLAFDWITSQFAKIPNMIKNVTSTLTFGLSDKIGSAVSNIRNSVVNNSSNTNAVINVNGTANPIATGNAIAGKLNKTTQMNFGGVAKA